MMIDLLLVVLLMHSLTVPFLRAPTLPALLEYTHDHDLPMDELVEVLTRRLSHPSWVVVFKALLVLHRLLRDSHEVFSS